MNIITNPIICGLIVSAACYMYIKWTHENSKQKEQSEDIDKISMMKFPIILGIITFISLSVWYNKNKSDVQLTENDVMPGWTPSNILDNKTLALAQNTSDTPLLPLDGEVSIQNFNDNKVGIFNPRMFLEKF